MRNILLSLWMIFGTTLCVLAQKPDPRSVTGTATGSNADNIRITKVSPRLSSLNGQITLTVTNLPDLLALADRSSKKLALFVNGIELSDLQPVGEDIGSNTLTFQLLRTVTNKDVWMPILSYPLHATTRPLTFSVGLHEGKPVLMDSTARDTYLWVIGWKWWTIAWLVVFFVLLFGFILLGIYSNMLRSPETDASGRHPYSLSRTQAGFWLFITAVSFVYIWAITGDTSTLNSGVLALLGISAGTNLAATLLDGKPGTQPPNQPGATQLPNLPPGNSPAQFISGPSEKGISKAVTNIQNLRFVGRFLGDLLSDSEGISVPRFQMFVWTFVLGVIFVVSVVDYLSMPDFNGPLVILMGISSATYVGAKLSK